VLRWSVGDVTDWLLDEFEIVEKTNHQERGFFRFLFIDDHEVIMIESV
jgi:hypothetical protein